MTWQKNCEMLKKEAKSATPLRPRLRMVPIKGNITAQTNMSVTLKALRKIFCGKAKTGPTEGKNLQTLRRNSGTTASNKGQGKWFSKFPTQRIELFTNFMQYI